MFPIDAGPVLSPSLNRAGRSWDCWGHDELSFSTLLKAVYRVKLRTPIERDEADWWRAAAPGGQGSIAPAVLPQLQQKFTAAVELSRKNDVRFYPVAPRGSCPSILFRKGRLGQFSQSQLFEQSYR
jgi:hypothetical protein